MFIGESRHCVLAEDPGRDRIQAVVATVKEIQNFLCEHTASTQRGFVCLLCDKRFSCADTIRVHARDKHVDADIVYPCPVCQKVCKTRNIFAQHLYSSHPEMKGMKRKELNKFARNKW